MYGLINVALVLFLASQCLSRPYDGSSEHYGDYLEVVEDELLRIPDIVGFHTTLEKRDNYTYNFTCVAKCDYEFQIRLYVDDRLIIGHQIQHENDISIEHMTIIKPVAHSSITVFKCVAENGFGLTTNILHAVPHGQVIMKSGFRLPYFIAKFDKHNCDMHMNYNLLPDNFPINIISSDENSTEIVYDSRAETRHVNDTNCDPTSTTHYDIAEFHYKPSGIYFTFEKMIEYKEVEEYFPPEVENNENSSNDDDVISWQPPEITSVGFILTNKGNHVELKLECSAEHKEHVVTWYVPHGAIVEHNKSRNEATIKLSKDDMETHEYVCQVIGDQFETSEIYLTISSAMNFDTIYKYSALFLFKNDSKDEAIFGVHLNKNHVISDEAVESVFIEGKHKTFYARKDETGAFYANGKLGNLMGKYKFFTDQHKKYQLNFEISRKSLFEYY